FLVIDHFRVVNGLRSPRRGAIGRRTHCVPPSSPSSSFSWWLLLSFSRDGQVLIHRRQDLAGRQAAGYTSWAEEGADHTVFINEDGRRRRYILTVSSRPRVQHRDRVDQLVLMIGHDRHVRQILLCQLGVIQTIAGNGDDAGVALGKLVVMRFELT